MTLIGDKNIFGTKNDNLKFHPAEKKLLNGWMPINIVIIM